MKGRKTERRRRGAARFPTSERSGNGYPRTGRSRGSRARSIAPTLMLVIGKLPAALLTLAMAAFRPPPALALAARRLRSVPEKRRAARNAGSKEREPSSSSSSSSSSSFSRSLPPSPLPPAPPPRPVSARRGKNRANNGNRGVGRLRRPASS